MILELENKEKFSAQIKARQMVQGGRILPIVFNTKAIFARLSLYGFKTSTNKTKLYAAWPMKAIFYRMHLYNTSFI